MIKAGKGRAFIEPDEVVALFIFIILFFIMFMCVYGGVSGRFYIPPPCFRPTVPRDRALRYLTANQNQALLKLTGTFPVAMVFTGITWQYCHCFILPLPFPVATTLLLFQPGYSSGFFSIFR